MSKEIRVSSKRKYKVLISENGMVGIEHLTIHRLLFPTENDYEYIYACNDRLDEILDMGLNQSIYIQPNRDDYSSKGIITRVS